MAKEFSRTARIESLIARRLAVMLQRELKDPRAKNVSITGVRVTRDLQQAKVYVALLSKNGNQDDAIKILNQSSSYLRYLLADKIQLRIMPTLQFVYDDSLNQGEYMTDLIDKAIKTHPKDDDGE